MEERRRRQGRLSGEEEAWFGFWFFPCFCVLEKKKKVDAFIASSSAPSLSLSFSPLQLQLDWTRRMSTVFFSPAAVTAS